MATPDFAEQTLFPGVAVITGAAGTGIGAAVAKAFASEGCTRFAITDQNDDLLDDTLQAIVKHSPRADIIASTGDISDAGYVQSFLDGVIRRYGRIDYLVNVAGIMGNNQATTETSLEDFDRINNINYRGVFLCSRAALKYMIKQEPLPSHSFSRSPQRGSIVSIASQLGIVGRPDAPAYCASKAAVIALTRADAIDYAKHGIRVNCVCPGVIDTPMTNSTPERVELLRPAVEIAPMKRMGLPEEIADAVLFLSSSKASFVQGHAMVVDGGYVIN